MSTSGQWALGPLQVAAEPALNPSASSLETWNWSVTNDTAVEAAWRRHLEKLDPAERALFEKHVRNDLESYVADITQACEAQRRTSKLFKIVDWFQPLFEVFSIYMPAANAVTQVYPNPGALVLGGISSVMQMSSEFLRYQERMAQVLSRMARKAEILSHYDMQLYREDSGVQAALVEVFGNILDFCRQALKLLKDATGTMRGGVKIWSLSLFRRFDTQFGAVIDTFETSLAQVEDKALLCDRKRAKASQMLQLDARVQQYEDSMQLSSVSQSMQTLVGEYAAYTSRQRQRERELDLERKRKDIMGWIPSTPFAMHFDEKCDAHLDGTGEWFIKSEEYNLWKMQETSSFLWVTGKPGCGKSVLSAMAISDLELAVDPEVAVAYVYCKALEPLARDPLILASSLLRQLCHRSVALDRVLEEYYDRTRDYRDKGPGWRQVTDSLTSIVSQFSDVFIVVDGLDECEDVTKLTELLNLMVEISSTVIKILVFSRPDYKQLETAFAQYDPIRIDEGLNSDDIQAYISTKLARKELGWNEDLLREVHQAVLSKSEGMFLWVELIVRTLKNQTKARQVRNAVAAVPRGLNEIYTFAFDQIAQNEDEDNRRTAFEMIMFTLNAGRALSQTEMLEALAIRSEQFFIDPDDVLMDSRGLTALCADLVVLNAEGFYVLIHASLKDYVLSRPVGSPSQHLEFNKLQANADHILAQMCLTYLLLDAFESGPKEDKNEFDVFQEDYVFYDYAATYLGTHLRRLNVDVIRDLLIRFAESIPHRELCIQHFINAQSKPFWKYPGTSTPLHVLAILGMEEIAKSCHQWKPLSFKADGGGYVALDFAFLANEELFCLWLLGSPAPGNSTPRSGYLPALHIAATRNWPNVVKVLLDEGHRVSTRLSVSLETPIMAAAHSGSTESVKVLLSAGAPIDAVDGKGATPLLRAAMSNHIETMRLLIEAGADVNSATNDGSSVLHCVAKAGEVEMAKTLIAKGADCNAKARKRVTAFTHPDPNFERLFFPSTNPYAEKLWNALYTTQTAAMLGSSSSYGSLFSSEELHKEGQTRSGATPLFTAAEFGQTGMMRALQEAGANWDMVDDESATALHHASAAGQVDSIRLLLSWSTKLLNIQTKSGVTALHEALLCKNPYAARLLLEAGADASICDDAGYGAGHVAAQCGYVELFDLLHAHRVNFDAITDSGETALHICCHFGNVEVANALLHREPSLNVNTRSTWNKFSASPLHGAVDAGSVELVRLLLGKGALQVPNDSKNLPLHVATAKGDIQIVELLLTPQNVNAAGNKQRTPLFLATIEGNEPMLRLLLGAGASIILQDEGHLSPLDTSLLTNQKEVTRLLLHSVDHSKFSTVLPAFPITAGTHGDEVLISRLLELGFDCFAEHGLGNTAFLEAVFSSDTAIVDLLVKRGFDGCKNVTRAGYSAIHAATLSGSIGMLHKVIDLGADPFVIDVYGRNAITHAVSLGDTEMFRELLVLGLSINLPNDGGDSALICCVKNRIPALVASMLEEGANTRTLSIDGQNPLVVSVLYQAHETAKILLEAGSSYLERDNFGLNAIDYARRHTETWKIFQNLPVEHLSPTSDSVRKKILCQTIKGRLASILVQNDAHSPAAQCKRQLDMWVLSNAVMYFEASEPNPSQQAVFCFSELLYSRVLPSVRLDASCNRCRKPHLREEVYFCVSCVDVELCTSCNSLLTDKHSNIRATGIQIIRQIELLERQIQRLRIVAAPYVELGAPFIATAIHASSKLSSWVGHTLEAYVNWDKKYNSDNRFGNYPRPGERFLNIIEDARECDALSEPLRELKNQELRKLNREHRPEQEFKSFECIGHKYIKVCRENFEERKATSQAYDSNGFLTRDWLQSLLDEYTTLSEELDDDSADQLATDVPKLQPLSATEECGLPLDLEPEKDESGRADGEQVHSETGIEPAEKSPTTAVERWLDLDNSLSLHEHEENKEIDPTRDIKEFRTASEADGKPSTLIKLLFDNNDHDVKTYVASLVFADAVFPGYAVRSLLEDMSTR